MTTTAQCPVCGNPQAQGLLDDACTTHLERALGDVRWIVTELDVTLSKQARIGTPAKGGLAREKNPIHLGALEAADTLGNVLTTWARDVDEGGWVPDRVLLRIFRNANAPTSGPLCDWPCGHDSCDAMRAWESYSPAPVASQAAVKMLSSIPAIRRHPAVVELMDEITDAIEQARRAVDRPAERAYLGQCMAAFPDEDGQDVTCYAEVWAKVDAHETTCRTCGITHEVAERRAWLLLRAADMLTTVKEASRYLGDVGGIAVTEASIRGLIHRQRLAYRAGTTTFRLGDLLEVLTDMRAKEAA